MAVDDLGLYPSRRRWVNLVPWGPTHATARHPWMPDLPEDGHMSDIRPQDVGETPSVEVRAYRHGKLIGTRFCETIDEAEAAYKHAADATDDQH